MFVLGPNEKDFHILEDITASFLLPLALVMMCLFVCFQRNLPLGRNRIVNEDMTATGFLQESSNSVSQGQTAYNNVSQRQTTHPAGETRQGRTV